MNKPILTFIFLAFDEPEETRDVQVYSTDNKREAWDWYQELMIQKHFEHSENPQAELLAALTRVIIYNSYPQHGKGVQPTFNDCQVLHRAAAEDYFEIEICPGVVFDNEDEDSPITTMRTVSICTLASTPNYAMLSEICLEARDALGIHTLMPEDFKLDYEDEQVNILDEDGIFEGWDISNLTVSYIKDDEHADRVEGFLKQLAQEMEDTFGD